MPDPPLFRAPYYPAKVCWSRADEFREEFWPSGDYPIDVLAIAEFGLGLEMRVVDNLLNDLGVDALLGIDFNTLAVDRDQYMQGRFHGRMRYSVAHEIGHYVLHRELAEQFPKDEKKLREFYSEIPEREYSFLEYHANEFAGALLVPRNELSSRLALYVDSSKPIEEGILVEAVDALAGHFAVSTTVIEIRLIKEKLIGSS